MKSFPKIQSTHPQSREKDQSKIQNNKCGSRKYRTQQPPEVCRVEVDLGPLFVIPFVSGGGGGDHESRNNIFVSLDDPYETLEEIK
jgi:hypothetical protein